MDTFIRLFAVTVLGYVLSWPPTPTEQTPTPAVNVAEKPLQRVWRDTTPLAKPGALCPQWWDVAVEAGWPVKDLPTLDYIMWRESRCRRLAHNTTLNADGSTDLGLTQINDWSWCKPTRYHPKGWLQAQNVIDSCQDLFDPYTNLRAARALYDYSDTRTGNGFNPWGK